MANKKTTEYLKYAFSEEETRANAKELARKNQQLTELDLKRKQLVSDLKAEAETMNADAARLARWVNDEYGFRLVDCEVLLDDPESGTKTIVRIDTGEIVKTEKMTSDELQQSLQFAGQ